MLLILRRDVPVWVLPGGGIDLGETPEQAIVREILEETGLTVKIDRTVGHYYPLNRLAKRTALFECSVLAGTPSLSPETRGVHFFPLSALPSLPIPYREWVEDGFTAGPPVKKQLKSVNYKNLVKYLVTHPILVFRFLLARLGIPINHSF
ncbi:MAG: NUDIX domain-containing protein [Verrucomicrobiota bacterium]|nr:NUDIX domain-containing protein [Verrucomicrobiota bacterium]